MKIAPRSPWQNPYCERLIGSIRRDVLDHVIILNEPHLRRVLLASITYYHRFRTHLALEMDCPEPERSSRLKSARRLPCLKLGAFITIMSDRRRDG